MSAGLAFLLSLPASLAQETDKRKATNAEGVTAVRIEPLRVINGELRGRTVLGRFKHGAELTSFALTFTRAEVINRNLQLRCVFSLEGRGARLSYQASATIAGAIAAAANPWPHASEEQRKDVKKDEDQQQGREAKKPEGAGQLGQLAQSTQDTTRKTPPATGDKIEQTQSHDAQSETVTGCGVIFLRLILPQRLRARMGAVAQPLQLGVVLKPFDNDLGVEIVKEICRLSQEIDPRSQSASLDQLNRLLSSK